MISTSQEFEEGVSFELYVLEAVCPVIDGSEGASLDLRGDRKIANVNMTLCDSLSENAEDRLKAKLSPLLFGTAWKVLDLLLEFALNRAGLRPSRRDWSIAEKQQRALRAEGDSSIVGCSAPIWSALFSLYANTVEHRHCLVHRTAKVDPESGVLQGVDRHNNLLTPLTREEQVALAKLSSLVARSVLQGGITPRSQDHLKHLLDLLSTHSGAPSFGGSVGLSAPVLINLSLEQENGTFFLDMSGVEERARRIFSTVSHFDLVIDVPDDSGRHLFAHLESCPLGKSSVDLEDLPLWLEYR